RARSDGRRPPRLPAGSGTLAGGGAAGAPGRDRPFQLRTPDAHARGDLHRARGRPRVIYYGILIFFVLEYVRPGNYIPPVNWLKLNTTVPVAVVIGSLFSKGESAKTDVMSETNTKLLGVFM